MKKSVYLFSLMLSILLCFWACNNDDGVDPSALLQMYGRQYKVESGVIWRNNPKEVASKVPYIYEDTYTNKEGQTVTDKVTGFSVGTEVKKMGNFMLSLYETGLVFNESLKVVKGRGACICFHLLSPDPENLAPGKYVYSNDPGKNTFIGYSSSDYNASDVSAVISPAEITEGEVTVEKTGIVYSVVFRCKTSFGGELSGSYTGELYDCQVPLLVSNFVENLQLAGLMDTITSTDVIFGSPGDPVKSLDEANGTAFLAAAKGICQNASAGGKELVDIALRWDGEMKSLCFESPIRMRSMLGHNDKFNFPCHTIYMRAPETFTDADFDKLEETGFTFTIQEEKVEFPISSFEPGFVFFDGGTGLRGVIRVKGFTPVGTKTTSIIAGLWDKISTANPTLKVDIKCPANFVNPRIR